MINSKRTAENKVIRDPEWVKDSSQSRLQGELQFDLGYKDQTDFQHRRRKVGEFLKEGQCKAGITVEPWLLTT